MKKEMDVMCCCGMLIVGACATFANVLAAESPLDKLEDQPGDTPTSSRPNILWLIAEDCGPDLGCYGNRLVRTPNLDRLASEGILYTRAYTSSPVCSPSRSCFNTGMYQTTLGAHHHRSYQSGVYKFPMGDLYLPEGVNVLSDWMRGGGYFTCNARKFPTGAVSGTGKTDWNFTYKSQQLKVDSKKPFDSDNWADLKSHQPFYAQVNFHETHTPRRRSKRPIDPAAIVLPPYIPDQPVFRKVVSDYFGDIQNLDDRVGEVLKQLDEDGLAQNTIVFFLGDNGVELLRGKSTNYEGGYHVPLIVRFPDRRDAGSVNDELVSMIDLAPTTLGLAGIDIPRKMQGQLFLGRRSKTREYVIGARDRIEMTLDRSRSVITKRYHYMRTWVPERPHLKIWSPRIDPRSKWYSPSFSVLTQLYREGKLTPAQAILVAPQRPPEELYDLQNDPHELTNLADSPAHKAVLAEMRSKLETWIRETKDLGEIPEDPTIIEGVIDDWKKREETGRNGKKE